MMRHADSLSQTKILDTSQRRCHSSDVRCFHISARRSCPMMLETFVAGFATAVSIMQYPTIMAFVSKRYARLIQQSLCAERTDCGAAG
mmetsp:Transcript_59020/g.131558  ORF Transcript_59020/g.131558 Transcript_59020/m.131558 type:complete len:88 (+) Transcript_59020:262-525(+)